MKKAALGKWKCNKFYMCLLFENGWCKYFKIIIVGFIIYNGIEVTAQNIFIFLFQ